MEGGSAGICLLEGVEDPLHCGSFDADAGILDRKLEHALWRSL